MLRILLTIVLPIVLPLVLYLGYLSLTRRRAQADGEERPPFWQEGPWAWLILSGAALLLVTLVVWRMSTGVPPGTKLESPSLVDGKVVPSHVRE